MHDVSAVLKGAEVSDATAESKLTCTPTGKSAHKQTAPVAGTEPDDANRSDSTLDRSRTLDGRNAVGADIA